MIVLSVDDLGLFVGFGSMAVRLCVVKPGNLAVN